MSQGPNSPEMPPGPPKPPQPGPGEPPPELRADLERIGRPPERSGLAIAALVLGILAFIPVVGLIAILVGILALVRIAGNRALMGRGMATAGLILGIVGTLVTCCVGPFVGTKLALRRAAQSGKLAASCRQNLETIGAGLSAYEGRTGEMPSKLTILLDTGDIPDASVLVCPEHVMLEFSRMHFRTVQRTTYAYAPLKKDAQPNDPSAVPIVWEGVIIGDTANVLYRDGTVRQALPDKLDQELEDAREYYVTPPQLPQRVE